MRQLIILIIYFFLIVYNISPADVRKKYLQVTNPPSQYSLLSCKLDAFKYGLTIILDETPKMSWFMQKLPVLKTEFFFRNSDGGYEIVDPLTFAPGGIHGQQARFDSLGKLFLKYKAESIYTIWNKNGGLDNYRLERSYGKIISFGIDNRLIANTFRAYFASKGISIDFINTKGLKGNGIRNELVRIINNGGIIVCNGVVRGFGTPRVYSFKIKDSSEHYLWKEASHSFVIVGYDLDRNTFRIADSYGDISHPYTPGFYDIDFDMLLQDLTLISPDSLDYTLVLSRTTQHLMD